MLHGWKWNEAEKDGTDEINNYLVSLVNFDKYFVPKLIGTAFIVAAYGNHAIAVSAAHNFWLGFKGAQKRFPAHNLSAIPDFIPGYEEIAVDRHAVRAIYQVGTRIEACVIGFVAWDKLTDLAVLTLSAQDPKDQTVFKHFCRLGQVSPKIGDLVGLIGYGDMDTLSSETDGMGYASATMSRRVVLRAGTVQRLHPDGHSLVRGSCIETSIPVYSGMSGGPAFLIPEKGQEMIMFGLISNDPDVPDELKRDRSLAGSSIIAMLPIDVTNDTESTRNVQFHFEKVFLARNPEFEALGR